MIHEALKPEWILPARKGSLREALAEMLRRAEMEVTEDRMAALEESLLRPEYATADAAFPHLTLPDLEHSRVLLALFPAGISSPHGTIYTAAMLLSPERDSVRHLQMLERLAALLPSVSRELSRLKTVSAIENRFSRAEQ